MPSNGIDWVARFGKPADEMTEGEWRVALTSVITDIEKRTRTVPLMETFYRVMIFLSPILISIMVAILLLVINHISHAG